MENILETIADFDEVVSRRSQKIYRHSSYSWWLWKLAGGWYYYGTLPLAYEPFALADVTVCERSNVKLRLFLTSGWNVVSLIRFIG